ncbi:Aste57867_24443 [Aphanomyces stellatus]|uniref:Aste57867_24443 protein n=1 Tax=Aphanomyces stellatus TaxID=120398 RepID=A0A485LQG2_9STRA|nr:hypothetical protein As57867_024367 [Aphanomyces stellatus]VFU01083.1 Aste57867_24443 [Aphanomyces stellatus]
MDAWPQLIFNISSTKVHGLLLRNTSGFVFEDRVNPMPSVVVRASNTALLNALVVELLSTETMDVLDVEFNNTDAVSGNYLIDIYIPTNMLQYVQTTDLTTAVVYANTLNVNLAADVSIIAEGASNVFVQADDIGADAILVEARGTSYVQVTVAQQIMADELDLVAAGEASLAVLAGTTSTNMFTATNWGPNPIFVGSSVGATDVAMLTTTDLLTKAYGSGDVVFLSPGACNSSLIEASASGNVYVNSMVCQDSTALLVNTGNIYLTSIASLKSADRGTGVVYADLLNDTAVLGTYSLVDSSAVVLPPFTSVPIPPHAASFIELSASNLTDVSQPSTDATAPPATKHATSSNSPGHAIEVALIVIAIAVLFGTLAAFGLYKRKKALTLRSDKITLTGDEEIEFTTVATPVGDVKTMQV